MKGFLRGFGDFTRSYSWYRRTPRAMRAALWPSAIVWLALFAAIIALAISLPVLVPLLTPFANDWQQPWQGIFRVGAGLGLLAAAIFIAIRLFSGLTTLVGERSYIKLRRAVDSALDGPIPRKRVSFPKHAATTLGGAIAGIPLAAVIFVLSLIPVVGVAISWATSATVSGRSLGRDLVETSLGTDAQDLLDKSRGRVAGFGVAAQLAMLIPFAGVTAMPAAVAGATELAHKLRAEARNSIEG